MKVKLTYFKESGKYYKEVHHLQYTNACPGINGNARQFTILVEPTDCAPYLVVP